jgi:hypothetical protein
MYPSSLFAKWTTAYSPTKSYMLDRVSNRQEQNRSICPLEFFDLHNVPFGCSSRGDKSAIQCGPKPYVIKACTGLVPRYLVAGHGLSGVGPRATTSNALPPHLNNWYIVVASDRTGKLARDAPKNPTSIAVRITSRPIKPKQYIRPTTSIDSYTKIHLSLSNLPSRPPLPSLRSWPPPR